jgi:hypothetical protein
VIPFSIIWEILSFSKSVTECPEYSTQRPGRAILVVKQIICSRVVGYPFVFSIPFDSCAHGQRNIGQMREAGGTMAFFQAAQRGLAALDAIQEVSNKVGSGVLTDTEITMRRIARRARN